MLLAQWLVMLVGIYAVIGLLFAIAFIAKGVARVDPVAAGAGWGFRLLILPGSVALWPLLLRRWLR